MKKIAPVAGDESVLYGDWANDTLPKRARGIALCMVC